MKILQIASGSKGNCTFIWTEKTKLILDCGISKKRIVECLTNNNMSLDNIDGILITHEHTDHISGLAVLANALNTTIYMTKGTYNGMSSRIKERLDINKINFIERDSVFNINDITINALQIFHDAVDPVGYLFKENNHRLVYITDTGYVHNSLFEKISDADAYIFESNHDPEILMESDRPYETKLRILSDHGHLSNQDSSYVLANIIGPNTKRIVFAHISEECNLVQIVKITSSRVFNDLGVSTKNIVFSYASQTPLEVFEI